MSTPIIETTYMLPPMAATIVIVCLAVAVAGLGVWLAVPVLMKLVMALEGLVRLVRRTMADEARLQHRLLCRDRDALNYWIRDSFHQKQVAVSAQKDAKIASARAEQERSMRVRIAEAADAAARGGKAYADRV